MCMHAHKCVHVGKRVGLAATPSTQASPRCALEPDAFAQGQLDTVICNNSLPFSPSSIFCTLVGGFPSQSGLKLVMVNGTWVFFLQGFPGSYVSEPSTTPLWRSHPLGQRLPCSQHHITVSLSPLILNFIFFLGELSLDVHVFFPLHLSCLWLYSYSF